jgi:hypothetical protein
MAREADQVALVAASSVERHDERIAILRVFGIEMVEFKHCALHFWPPATRKDHGESRVSRILFFFSLK